MTKARFISQSLVKRRTAAALANAKDRHGWSDNDAAEALGVCRSTILNRLDSDDPGKQMTIHELLRSIEHDGNLMVNEILALVDYEAAPKEPKPDVSCDRTKESRVLQAALALSVALADGEISDTEILANRTTLDHARDAIDALLRRVGPKAEPA